MWRADLYVSPSVVFSLLPPPATFFKGREAPGQIQSLLLFTSTLMHQAVETAWVEGLSVYPFK